MLEARAHTLTHSRAHTLTRAHRHTCTCSYTHAAHTHSHTRAHRPCTYTHSQVHTHAHVLKAHITLRHTCPHAFTHTHTGLCTRSHMHTHTQMSRRNLQETLLPKAGSLQSEGLGERELAECLFLGGPVTGCPRSPWGISSSSNERKPENL